MKKGDRDQAARADRPGRLPCPEAGASRSVSNAKLNHSDCALSTDQRGFTVIYIIIIRIVHALSSD
jgi:hypothetical protein